MTTSITLTDLVPTSSYLLVYALPLLLLSLILTFSGAFLTLDRSRSFVPSRQVSQLSSSYDRPKSRYFRLYLEGGVGGILIGYCFGLHISTCLALLIPNDPPAAALSYKSFVAVWFLSSLPTAALAGRFKYVALTFAGVTGGISLALGLSVSFHPALLTRRVLVALLVSVLTILTLLPIAKVQHHSVRLAANSTGAFGLVLSIALLAHVSPWADIWERLWLSDGEDWGTTAERGLSAAFWLLLVLGSTIDFFLNRCFGGNPDEKWDSYLVDYTGSLPNSADRAGVFQPVSSSFWDRLSHWTRKTRSSVTQPLFPFTTNDIKVPISPESPLPSFSAAVRETEKVPLTGPNDVFEYEKKPGILRKASARPMARLMALTHAYSSESMKSAGRSHGGRKREVVKFRPLSGCDGLTSDEDDDYETKVDDILSTPPPKRRLSNRTTSSKTLTNEIGSRNISGSKAAGNNAPVSSSSEVTLDFDYGREKALVLGDRAAFGDATIPEYSDTEEDDVTAQSVTHRGTPSWTPPFIARHTSNADVPLPAAGPVPLRSADSAVSPIGAVSMTPSLMYALNRVTVAQRDALTNANGTSEPVGLPATAATHVFPKEDAAVPLGGRNRQRWDSFWKDVTDKAGEVV